jgi:hypothetical protein
VTESPTRQHPRYAVEASVELRSSHGMMVGRTRNVSRGGLCAELSAPLAAGDRVAVSLALVFDGGTLSERLSLPARIVWCTALGEHHQVGVQFLPLSDDQRAYLDMFLRYLKEGQAALAAAAAPDDPPDDPFAT